MMLVDVPERLHPRLVEIWEASVRATHHFLPEAYIQTLKPLLPSVYLPAVNLTAAVDERDEITGFVGVADHTIEMLFVAPEHRGKGVGRALVEHANTTRKADLVDVNEQNEQAIGFYLRMGFEVIGRSDLDGRGEPFPLLHMKLGGPARS